MLSSHCLLLVYGERAVQAAATPVRYEGSYNIVASTWGLAFCRCWPPMLAGRDVQAVAEPGSGKTFGYLLPAVKFLHNQPADARRRVLILVPTRWARVFLRTSSLMCIKF